MRPVSSILSLLLLAGSLAGQTPAARPHSDVEGDVINSATGEPIGGARVKLSIRGSLADALYGKTDAKGHFRIPDVPAGRYQVWAEANGCMRGVLEATAPAAGAPLRLALTPYGVIGARLTDPNGRPYPYTFVHILALRQIPTGTAGYSRAFPGPDGQHEWDSRYTGWPDDRGEFTTMVEPGTYHLVAGDNANSNTWDRSYRRTFYPAWLSFRLPRPSRLRRDNTCMPISGFYKPPESG